MSSDSVPLTAGAVSVASATTGSGPDGGPAAESGGHLPTVGWWARLRRHRLAAVGAVTLGILTIAVLVGPLLLPYGAEEIDHAIRDAAPSWAHPMGTDELGRDQLVRVLVGGRLTLAVAACAVLLAMTVGVLVGAVAGYAGGFVDSLLMRIVDAFYTLPTLFVVIILVTLLGPNFWTIVIAIGALSWMNVARLVRATYLSVKEMDFVEAARTVGVPNRRIAVRHILPNVMGPVIVAATLGVAIAILVESGLSFLGLGFQPPQATWGGMLQESRRAVISFGHWWRGLFPGLMIFITVLSASFVGDGLRDALDPRRRR